VVDVTTSVLLEPVRLWSAPARLLAEGRWDEESQAVARGSHPRVARIPHQLTERRHPGAVRHGRGGHEAQRLQGVTAQNPGARADAAVPNSTVGSPLYRLNIWYMMWGSMIAARPLPFPKPGPLSDSQTQTMARRREQTPGCAFRTPGTCLVPMPLWMS